MTIPTSPGETGANIALPAAALLLAALAAAAPAPAAGAPHPTPEIRAYNLVADTPERLTVGFGAELPDGTRVGAVVACLRASGAAEVAMHFGAYPSGRPVQAAVRTASGRIERFGGVERGSPATGFHSPRFRGRRTVARYVRSAMTAGALVSNGHNSVRNRIPAPENARQRKRLLDCMEGPRR